MKRVILLSEAVFLSLSLSLSLAFFQTEIIARYNIISGLMERFPFCSRH